MAQMQQVQGQRSPLPPFLEKTYELVDNDDTNNLISWTSDGTEIMIKDPNEFEKILLPRHFKHRQFSSFIRQLNNYGFKKVSADSCVFRHELFKKGGKHRLCEIKRKTSPSLTIQAATSPSRVKEDRVVMLPPIDAEIVQENKSLKRENVALKHELQRFKSFIGHVAGLLNDFSGNDSGSAIPMESSSGGPVVPMESSSGGAVVPMESGSGGAAEEIYN